VVNATTFPTTLTLYVGAAQCEISKGTDAGNVTITKSGTSVTVTFNLKPAFFLTETHVYYGTAAKVPKSFAPGQYGNTLLYGSATQVSGTHTFTYKAGNVFILHAGVCGDKF
jgi:hypothetical protein